MISAARKTAFAYLLATFLAGGLAGVGLGYYRGRQPVFRPPSPDAMLEKSRTRLITDLALTEAQLQKIDPILKERAAALKKARNDSMQQFRTLMDQYHQRVAALLTPDQQVKYEARRLEREKKWRPDGPGERGDGERGPRDHGREAVLPPPK